MVNPWLVVVLLRIQSGFGYENDCDVEVPGITGYVSSQIDILSPAHGEQYSELPGIALEVTLLPWSLLELENVRFCLRLDNSSLECASPNDAREGRWPPALPLNLKSGKHRLEAFVAILIQGTLRRIDCNLLEHDSIDFIKTDNSTHKNDDEISVIVSQRICPASRLVVTAADEAYFDRLSNLVGSLHAWILGTRIAVYDLGLSQTSLNLVKKWRDVKLVSRSRLLKSLPHEIMSHVSLVGWKFWILLHALESAAEVLWLDANFEIRRPLTAIWRRIQNNGFFLTVAGHRFPTAKTARPATLEYFKCNAQHATRTECTSAAVGVRRNSSFHALVLPAVHACSLNLFTCLYPSDSLGNTNNRRDQSVLNAVLCIVEDQLLSDIEIPSQQQLCDPDRRYWSYVGQRTLLPTSSPQKSNQLFYFQDVATLYLTIHFLDDGNKWHRGR